MAVDTSDTSNDNKTVALDVGVVGGGGAGVGSRSELHINLLYNHSTKEAAGEEDDDDDDDDVNKGDDTDVSQHKEVEKEEQIVEKQLRVVDYRNGGRGGGGTPPLRVKFRSPPNDGIASIPASPTLSANSPSSPSSPITSSPASSSSSSSSSSSNSSLAEVRERRSPDGGWGWVVVAASFMVNLIADGITFSFGVIFVEFLNYFGENRGTTAWVGSLFMAMPLLSGPVASFLTDRYGCRRVTIAGALLASLGFVVSSRANSMAVLCVTFGIAAGFGLSLCYVASVVIVAYYFDKNRSFATGLAVCGSGIGTFIFPPFIQYLLFEYGWRGTTLILAGLFLNLMVCGALMRDLPWTTEQVRHLARERKRKRHAQRRQKRRCRNYHKRSAASLLPATIVHPNHEGVDRACCLLKGVANDEHAQQQQQQQQHRLCASLVHLPTYVAGDGEVEPEPEALNLLAKHGDTQMHCALVYKYPNLLLPLNGRMCGVSRLAPPPPPPQPQPLAQPNMMQRKSCSASVGNGDVGGCNVGGCGGGGGGNRSQAFLKGLRVHRLSVTYRGAMLNINRYRLRASSCPDIYRNSMTTIAWEMEAKEENRRWYGAMWELWDLLVDMFDFSHFSDINFLLFSISNFLLYTWYDVPYMYLTDHAQSLGHSQEDASILISFIGIINMLGEIILGWAGDRPRLSARLVYAICMVFCGAVTALVPLMSSYSSMCMVAGAFGFFIAANYALTCIILVELISLDRFTNAYGLLLLVQGVANLVGPPLGGWLYDVTKSYDLSFYLSGIFIALSGVLMVILPMIKVCKRRTATAHSIEVTTTTTNHIGGGGGGGGGRGQQHNTPRRRWAWWWSVFVKSVTRQRTRSDSSTTTSDTNTNVSHI